MNSSAETALPILDARTPRRTCARAGLVALLVAGLGCNDPASSSDSGTGDLDGGSSGTDGGTSAPDGGEPVADGGGFFSCSPLLQNCPEPAAKCSLIETGSGYGTLFCEDVDAPATVAEGDPCTTRFGGYDDCAPGLVCAGVGSDVFRCRPYCVDASDCGTQADCVDLTLWAPDDVRYGFCAPTCTAFGACPTDLACERLVPRANGSGSFLVCRSAGPNSIGSFCSRDRDCAAGAMCATGICRAVCDEAHPCDSGTCAPLPAADGAIGTCS